MFYSPLIRSEPFCEPVTPDCDLHKCFCFSSPLCGTGWPELAGAGYFPSPMWKARMDWRWVFSFPQDIRGLIISPK